jgi:hypothetical protein
MAFSTQLSGVPMELITNAFTLFHEVAGIAIAILVILAIAVTILLVKLFQKDLSNLNM